MPSRPGCELEINVNAEGGQTRLQTGRTMLGDRHGRHDAVKLWSTSGAGAADHPEARVFAEAVRRLPLVTAQCLPALRGIARERSVIVNSSLEMGPPPAPNDQRYSSRSCPALYLLEEAELASAIDAVRKEVKPEAGQRLWLQRLKIPAISLKIADLAVSASDPFSYCNCVLDHAERVESTGGNIFTRTVGRLFAEEGFGGIRVPGVRGDRVPPYNNLVLFAFSEWRQWLDDEWRPRLIDE